MLKKVVLSVVAALVSTAPSFAADLPVKAVKAPAVAPSPWDIAFGAALMNDYVFRGITQSNHSPSVAAYFEPRYNIDPNLQLYVGVAGESISFPNRAAAEIDAYGGIRPTFGAFAFDFGAWFYGYPGGTCFAGTPTCPNVLLNGNVAKRDASFVELYGKLGVTAGDFLIGLNEFYSPNFLNTGAWGDYVSGTLKYTVPSAMLPANLGFYASGEFGRQFLGTSDAFYGVPAFPAGVKYADYNTWNLGVGVTWKVFTLDLRYSDTDLSRGNCNAFTSDHTAGGVVDVTPINPSGVGSKWCGSTFIAKLSIDSTLAAFK